MRRSPVVASSPRRVLLGALALTLLLLGVTAPAAMARDMYVADLSGGNVLVIDSQTGQREATIDVTEAVPGPQAIAISPDGGTAYVAGGFTGSPGAVQAIDTRTRQPIGRSIPVGEVPQTIAVSPDGKTVYVADRFDDEISVIDTRTEEVSSIPAVGSPWGLAISPDGDTLYVPDEATNRVAVIDAGTGRVVKRIRVGLQPGGVAVSPDGATVYVADQESGEVSVIDTRTGSVTSIPVDGRPTKIAVSPDGGTVYVADEESGEVSVIDTRTESVTSIPVGWHPQGIAVSPDGRTVYVLDSEILTIDVATKTVTTLALAGGEPTGIATVPDQPPVAALAPASGTAGTPLAFDASASTDPDGTIAAFDWRFGDGHSAFDAGATPSHAYSAAGTYRPTVTLTDDEGCSTKFVFTGQTAYCNGSAVAERTIDVPVAARATRLKPKPELARRPPVARREPSNHFLIRKLRHNRRNGTVRMRLWLPGAGAVRLRGPQVRPVWRKVGRAQGLTLVVRPRRMLNVALKRRRHRARVRVRVTFTPAGGTARTRVKRLTLRRAAGGPGVRRVHASRLHRRER